MSEVGEGGRSMARDVRRGLVWSTANNLILRLGTLVLGMALARLLAPKDFGVFAVGLTVQSILMTLNDLGLSADLIRSDDPDRRAPTVATLSAASGGVLAIAMIATAGPVASVMGAPQAANVLRVLALTIPVSSAGVVPYTHLMREFQQGRLFVSSAIEFAVYTGGTLVFVMLGMGPMALALGRLLAQVMATSSQFILAKMPPRFGFDRSVARSALAYGMPLAGANLLSWALLNVDNMTIARVAGATSLGLYVLAFNISTWPMSAIGTAVRSVALPAFSRIRNDHEGRSLVTALSLTWALALPIGVLLGALAHPLIVLFYGARWAESAVVLGALAMFGALRVAFDLIATYLSAKGASRPLLYVTVLWFFGLIPPMIFMTQWLGIAGAGWTHVAVAFAVILPAYIFALTRLGLGPWTLLPAVWLPSLAAVPTWWVAHTVAAQMHQPVLALLFGGTAGMLAYLAICHRWLLRLRPQVSQSKAPVLPEPVLAEVA